MIEPTSYREVSDTYEAIKKAVEEYQRDIRFRALVDSTVAAAMQEFGPIDPDQPSRDAADIARNVAALLLARVYHEDIELRSLRAERDRLRKALEEHVLVKPGPLMVFPATV